MCLKSKSLHLLKSSITNCLSKYNNNHHKYNHSTNHNIINNTINNNTINHNLINNNYWVQEKPIDSNTGTLLTVRSNSNHKLMLSRISLMSIIIVEITLLIDNEHI